MPNFVRISNFLGTSLRRLHYSREDLRLFQEKRLKAVINYAYTFVPFYNRKFKAAGIRPSDISRIEDLAKLPIVRKDELRKADPHELISSEYTLQNLKSQRTSGSTGVPFKFYTSPVEDDWRRAIYLRANISCGQRPFDKWVFITSPLNFVDVTGIQRKLNIYAPRCISVFDRMEKQAKLVELNNPDILDGYSGALILLANFVRKNRINSVHPRLIFGSAELIDFSSRKYLEDTFGAPYLDQFGCAEVQRTAWQCLERVGYHMDADSVITQFVDGDGKEVSAGETGEIVHTSLFNFAMPFIKYSAGDMGRASKDECPCGRVLPLMEIVEGRKDSFVVLPSGRILSPRTFTVAMSMFDRYDRINQFRVVQEKLGFFKVYLQMKINVENEAFLTNALESHLLRILDLAAENVRFGVTIVDKIPLSDGGKLMSVISNLNHKELSFSGGLH